MTYFECLELLDDLIADSSKGTVVFDISDIAEIRRNLSDCYTADAYHKLEDDRANLEQKYLAEKEALAELIVNHEKICNEHKALLDELDDVNDTLSDYKADLKQATSDMLAAEAKANVYKAKCEAYEGVIGMVKELKK